MKGHANNLTRRSFLRYGACALCACASARFLPGNGWAAETGLQVARPHDANSKYWSAPGDGNVQCGLCPNGCVMKPGAVSFCHTRVNEGGKLVTYAYDNPCILAVEPFGKIPLYHFLPDTRALTLGIAGCNLRCTYCQNWQQAQSDPRTLKNNYSLTKEQAVNAALKRQCSSIAFTYTDAVAFFEYARDLAEHAKASKLRVAVGTAAHINAAPLKDLCAVSDAFSVTLKGFDEDFYKKVTAGQLKTVLLSLETIKAEGKWLEVVNLLLPTMNDDEKHIRDMCRWIGRNLGSDTPLHFERYLPDYKLRDLPQTPLKILETAYAIAREEGLRYVYICNVSPHAANCTYCPKCGDEIIRRLGYYTNENKMVKGTCGKCKTAIPGIWS